MASSGTPSGPPNVSVFDEELRSEEPFAAAASPIPQQASLKKRKKSSKRRGKKQPKAHPEEPHTEETRKEEAQDDTDDDGSAFGDKVRTMDPELLARIVNIIDPNGDYVDCRAKLQEYFAKLGVVSWDDMSMTTPQVFERGYAGWIDCGPFALPIFVSKLWLIFRFSDGNPLTDTTTLETIKSTIKSQDDARSSSFPDDNASMASSAGARLHKVPQLPKFAGTDEKWLRWKEAVVDQLGRYGLADLVDYTTTTLPEAVDPRTVTAVFYAMKQALAGGLAYFLVEDLTRKKCYDPKLLMESLVAHFDTPIHRQNCVTFAMRDLAALVLTPDKDINAFINDFQHQLGVLEQYKEPLREGHSKGLLLQAIQDESYMQVSLDVMKTEGTTTADFLDALRLWETHINMVEGSRSVGGPTGSSARSRRTKQPSQQADRQKGKASTGQKSKSRWNLPKFPKSWHQTWPKSFITILMKWYSDVKSGMTQDQLDLKHSLKVTTSDGATGRFSKKKSRRAKGGNSDETAAEHSGSDTDHPTESRSRRVEISYANKDGSVIAEYNG